jgi:phage anti-repressor protein
MNKSLKNGLFTQKEMLIYGLNEEEIDIVTVYQEKLPILNQNDKSWINARDLHEQLQIKSKFADWVKNRIEKYEFIEKEDYLSVSKNLESGGKQLDYTISINMAKELSIVENNDIGRIARKYFIIMEKLAKFRVKWNENRYSSIEMCKELKHSILVYGDKIEEYIPNWFYCPEGKVYAWEFNMLNTIIIGMSATKYREIKGLKKSFPVRNTFSERELFLVHKLEEYNSNLIDLEYKYNCEEREALLMKYFNKIIKQRILDIA